MPRHTPPVQTLLIAWFHILSQQENLMFFSTVARIRCIRILPREFCFQPLVKAGLSSLLWYVYICRCVSIHPSPLENFVEVEIKPNSGATKKSPSFDVIANDSQYYVGSGIISPESIQRGSN